MMLTHRRSASPRRVRKVKGNHIHVNVAEAVTDAVALEAELHLTALVAGIDQPSLRVGQAGLHTFKASYALGVEKIFHDL